MVELRNLQYILGYKILYSSIKLDSVGVEADMLICEKNKMRLIGCKYCEKKNK